MLDMVMMSALNRLQIEEEEKKQAMPLVVPLTP
jgi:hypothetical protein